MQQNINISGGQGINIIQAGGDVYYTKQEKARDLVSQQRKTTTPDLDKMVQAIIEIKKQIKESEKEMTIFFSDISGYTRKSAEEDIPDVLVMLKELENLITPIYEKNNGYKVKTIGDAYLLTFKSPDDGVRTGIELQNALSLENTKKSEKEQIHIRIGINTGKAIELKDKDVISDAVNVASRLEGKSLVDSILIGEATYLGLKDEELKVTIRVPR